MSDNDRQKNLSKASGQAFNALKEAHVDEWNVLMQCYAAELGEEWEPRKTEEQKEREQALALLAKYPDLVLQSGSDEGTGVAASGAGVIGEENTPVDK